MAHRLILGACCIPWFTNSFGLLLLPAPCWSLDCGAVLIEDMLLCDCSALFPIPCALVLQKPSDKFVFLTERPWILKPFEGSSTAIIGAGLAQPQHPRQLLLCSKTVLTSERLASRIRESEISHVAEQPAKSYKVTSICFLTAFDIGPHNNRHSTGSEIIRQSILVKDYKG